MLMTAGALACLGRGKLLFSFHGRDQDDVGGNKFLADAKMSFQDIFDFAYGGNMIPLLQGLAEEMGRSKLIKSLRKIVSDRGKREGRDLAAFLGSNDLAAYVSHLHHPARFWTSVMTYEIVENKDNVLEARITECLWAKTFREAGAEDIGYAWLCYGDFAGAEGFNPKLKLSRTKTLMLGDECCNHRFVMSG